MRLRRVLEDRDTDLGKHSGAAVQMNRDDGPGASSDGAPRGVNVDGRSPGFDVDEDRHRTNGADGSGGWHGRHGRNDHFVVRAYANGEQSEPKCFGARRDRDGVRAPERRRELFFEGLRLRAQQIRARRKDTADRVREVGLETSCATRQIEERKPL
jgi:hypothetical protein